MVGTCKTFSVCIHDYSAVPTAQGEVKLENPLQATFGGIKAYIEGFGWLKRHPRYLFVLLVPSLVGLFSLFIVLGAFFVHFNTIPFLDLV